jgi:hypothetical protein
MRGKFRSHRDGTYHFKSVLPKGYQIPKKRGMPDVVFMKWAGYPKGGEKGALGRAWDKTEKSWIPREQAQ